MESNDEEEGGEVGGALPSPPRGKEAVGKELLGEIAKLPSVKRCLEEVSTINSILICLTFPALSGVQMPKVPRHLTPTPRDFPRPQFSTPDAPSC